MIRFSLVHSCELVATRPLSEARLVSVEFWACFSLLTLVILDHSEEPSHGLWNLYLPRSILWLLYIQTLSLPLLVPKAASLGGCCAWLSLNGFVLVLVSNDITSFQPLCRLGFALDVLQRPQVFVSPGVFFSRHLWLSFEWSWFSCLAIRDLCFVLFLTLRCFPWSCPLGCSCQPERLHRHPLASAITVASVWRFYQRGFSPSVVFTPDLCDSYAQLCQFLPWCLLSQYGWSIPSSVVFVRLLPSDSFVSKVFPLVRGVSIETWSPFGTSLHLFTEGIVINSSFSFFSWDWLGIWLVRIKGLPC